MHDAMAGCNVYIHPDNENERRGREENGHYYFMISFKIIEEFGGSCCFLLSVSGPRKVSVW